MARPTLQDSLKFKMLVRKLGIPAPHVQGHLEYMWRPAYASGVPRFRSLTEIEAAAEWAGDPGVFAAAVTHEDHNFVDTLNDGTYEIHDFWDHAPEYVKGRYRKERERQKKRETVTGTSRDSHATVLKKSDTPAPAPAPAPNNTPLPPEGVSRSRLTTLSPAQLKRFEQWYAVYPHKVSRGHAEKAFATLNPDDALVAVMVSAVKREIEHKARLKAAKQFCPEWPNPATWLNGKRWEDRPSINTEPDRRYASLPEIPPDLQPDEARRFEEIARRHRERMPTAQVSTIRAMALDDLQRQRDNQARARAPAQIVQLDGTLQSVVENVREKAVN